MTNAAGTYDAHPSDTAKSEPKQAAEKWRRTTQTTLEGKVTWDFLRSFSVKESHEFTHGLHIYPAKIVPQIARELIAKFSNPLDVVLDPFCGSGTVLVESLVANRHSIGIDINTLALLLAKVKTTPLRREEVLETMNTIVDNAKARTKSALNSEEKVSIEKIPNVHHWFKPYVARELALLNAEIQQITNQEIRDFFRVCFSATMFNVSNIRKADNPYFIRIFHEDEMVKHKPVVLEQFTKTVKKNSESIKSIEGVRKQKASVRIINGNTRELVSILGKKSADLIVTSPPYGEEKNTMDYARFSKLALYWLGLDGRHVKEMKENALGCNLRHWQEVEIDSKTLKEKLKEVAKKSQLRADEVYSFFYDYLICLEQMFETCKEDSSCCIVIGDRTAAGIPIPNGKVTCELCENVGFVVDENVQRKMYLRALRSNVIANESILIARRP
jgi:site-specific DNA-methyltransferase (cytosine-N4-specific)